MTEKVIIVAPCKGIGIPESIFACLIRVWEIFFVESQILALESGIQLKESGSHYRLESKIHVPLTKNPGFGFQYLESKTVLAFLTWGEGIFEFNVNKCLTALKLSQCSMTQLYTDSA